MEKTTSESEPQSLGGWNFFYFSVSGIASMVLKVSEPGISVVLTLLVAVCLLLGYRHLVVVVAGKKVKPILLMMFLSVLAGNLYGTFFHGETYFLISLFSMIVSLGVFCVFCFKTKELWELNDLMMILMVHLFAAPGFICLG